VVIWGLDRTGLSMADLVGRRAGFALAGAIDTEPGRVGRDVGDLIGFGQHLGLMIDSDPERVLTLSRPDITLIGTDTAVDEVAPKVLQAMEAGSNVICLAEEMVYPWVGHPDLAESIDELAHAHGVTVLGTGINPGFVFDTLTIALTGCCADVERIRASRVVDLAGLDEAALAAEGVGLSPSDYHERLARGRVRRSTGLEQSAHLIADTLLWRVDKVELRTEPILAAVRRESPAGRIEPGQVAGSDRACVAYVGGVVRILLENPAQAVPEQEGIQIGDFIDIEGTPNVRVTIQPGIDAVKGSAAIAINMIPAVLNAGPGLKSMADLPIPRAVLGDVREALAFRGPTVEEELARGWHIAGLGEQEGFPSRPANPE
jgi:hypothetical protein